MDPDFLVQNTYDYTIIDVRSPSEYLKGHIPSAINIPLFSDEERKIIGTSYKREGRKYAIEKGLSFLNLYHFAKNFEPFVDKQIVLYCARGGMRSSSVAWLLSLLDYKIHTLKGGYKIFRKWVNDQFKKTYKLKLLGGCTGVGKTAIIKTLKNSIDLEGLANHKGSVFGGLDKKQPSQEHFENLLAMALFSSEGNPIFIEDESRFIGNVYIPNDFYEQMKLSPIVVLEDLIENRINKCVSEYKDHKHDDLKNAIKKIEKKLGSLSAKKASDLIDQQKYKEACTILFSYYDKSYSFSLKKRATKDISYFAIFDKSDEQISIFLQSSS